MKLSLHTPFPTQFTGKKFGIELEMEEVPIRDWWYDSTIGRLWDTKGDGSLRGDYPIEFITAKPVGLEETEKSLIRLFKLLDKHVPNRVLSNRCSTHVHVNCQDLETEAVGWLSACSILVEPYLFAYAGRWRENTPFALPTWKCIPHVHSIWACLFPEGNEIRFKDQVRSWEKYSSINMHPLVGGIRTQPLGTIEYRMFSGGYSAREVMTWINLINKLYDFAVDTYKDSGDILSALYSKKEHVGRLILQEMGDAEVEEGLLETNLKTVMGAKTKQELTLSFGEKKKRPSLKRKNKVGVDIEAWAVPPPDQRARVDEGFVWREFAAAPATDGPVPEQVVVDEVHEEVNLIDEEDRAARRAALLRQFDAIFAAADQALAAEREQQQEEI